MGQNDILREKLEKRYDDEWLDQFWPSYDERPSLEKVHDCFYESENDRKEAGARMASVWMVGINADAH